MTIQMDAEGVKSESVFFQLIYVLKMLLLCCTEVINLECA